MLDKTKINYVIYHGGCTDGFTSAMIVWKIFGDKAEYIPYYHGNKIIPDVTGKHVLIVDLSFGENIMLDMIEKTDGNIMVLDHHKTGREALANIPDEYKQFDYKLCGATLTWKYLHGDDEIPLMIQYVEDNDLWKKEMDKTRDFTSFVFALPFEFEEYAKLLQDDYIKDVVLPLGAGMNAQNEFYTRELSKKTRQCLTKINDVWYLVAYIDTPILKSELGNYTFQVAKYANFSAMYTRNHQRGNTSFALRSTNDRTDVEIIANVFSGGGHRNAAGMAVDLLTDTIPGKAVHGIPELIDILYEVYNPTYDFVAFNSPVHVYSFSKYLMQERTPGVLESLAIMRIKKNDMEYKPKTGVYSGAFSWHYDGEKYIIQGIFSPEVLLEIKNKYSDAEFDNDFVKFISKGIDHF